MQTRIIPNETFFNKTHTTMMKRPLLNSAIVAISLAFFASCKSSDSDSNFPTKFSSNTVEENKTNLENNGIDMVNLSLIHI